MSFKVNHHPKFTHDVTVLVPTDDGHEEQKLRTKFQAIPISEAGEFNLNSWDGQNAYFKRVVLSFENLVDEQGKPIDCTPELIKSTLDLSYVRQALTQHLNIVMFKVKAGN